MELVVYNTHDLPFPFGDALVCAILLLLEKLVGSASSLGVWSWLFTTPTTSRFHLETPSCVQSFSSWRSWLVAPLLWEYGAGCLQHPRPPVSIWRRPRVCNPSPLGEAGW